MNARLRLLAAAGAVALYCAGPSMLRVAYPLLASPTACAQRAETLAQVVFRVEALAHILRRS